MINLALRFDDPSKTSNHELESRIIQLLEKYRIPATFAVVPYQSNGKNPATALERQEIAHLIKAEKKGIIEVAVHGHSHVSNGYSVKNSEFSDHTLDAQAHLIKAARHILEGIFDKPVTGFVPPWNRYDANTVRVLKNQGFDYLSANWNDIGINEDINFIPRTCNIMQTRLAIEEARFFGKYPNIIVPVFHHYDFKEQSGEKGVINLNDFSALLDWISHQSDIGTTTLKGISQLYSPLELQKPIQFHQRFKNSHWRIRQFLPQYSLQPNKKWSFSFAFSRHR